MNERRKAMEEWRDLALEARRIEDEMLEIPRSAARRSDIDVDLLFTAENRPKLIEKYKELQAIEAKRDEARKRFFSLSPNNS